MRKYELTDETKTYFGRTLHRIKAIVDFGCINAGEIGGWIEKEENLSHYGNAWVYGNAQVYGDARVSGNAQVSVDARVSVDAQVSGNAQVYGNARVSGNAWVSGNAKVYDDAQVYDNAQVYGNARVSGDAQVAAKECIFWIGAIGSRNGTTTFFNCKDGKIRVSCGCFYGDLDEFLEAVNKTHGDNEYGQVYRIAIEMAKKRIHTVCHEVKRNDQD